MSKMMEIEMPFCGFYESLHGQAVTGELERAFWDDHCEPFEDLLDKAYDALDLREVRRRYAEAYVKHFSSLVGDLLPSLRFKEMFRPHAYNYDHDRLYAEASVKDIVALHKATPKEVLAKVARERFTPRSGWSPNYSPQLDKWKADPREWDHNEVGTLLLAHLEHKGMGRRERVEWEQKFCMEISDGDTISNWFNEVAYDDSWKEICTEYSRRYDAGLKAASYEAEKDGKVDHQATV